MGKHNKQEKLDKKLQKKLLKEQRKASNPAEVIVSPSPVSLPTSTTEPVTLAPLPKEAAPLTPVINATAVASDSSYCEANHSFSESTSCPANFSTPAVATTTAPDARLLGSNILDSAVDGAALTFAACVIEDIMLDNDFDEEVIEYTNMFMQAFMMFCRGGVIAGAVNLAANKTFHALGFTEQSSVLAGTIAGVTVNAVSTCESASDIACLSTAMIGSYIGSRATLFAYNHFFNSQRNSFRNEDHDERIAARITH